MIHSRASFMIFQRFAECPIDFRRECIRNFHNAYHLFDVYAVEELQRMLRDAEKQPSIFINANAPCKKHKSPVG